MTSLPSNTDDMSREFNCSAAAERLSFTNRDRYPMDHNNSAINAAPMRPRNVNDWAEAPPFPTPALTTSSLSSSSFFGDRSPVLTPGAHGQPPQCGFDSLSMTMLPPPSTSFDSMCPQPITTKTQGDVGYQSFSLNSVRPSQSQNSMAAMASSLSALNLSDQQGQSRPRSAEAALNRPLPTMSDPQPPAPLLIPMQPTGAGVQLTNVVETLSTKGSQAASEDPETVAAAYKLHQLGIG